MTLTKRDLVMRIGEETGLNQAQVFEVVQKTMNYITEALAKGGKVELQAPTAVGSGDFHEKAVKVKFWFTCDYEFERDALARQERIALPSELARESGSRFDPMSLEREECDHLVNGLASRRRCRRTVITPRLASIQMLLLKVFLLWFRPGSAPAWGW